MRRIDVLLITFGIFLGGGGIYFIFTLLGIENINAGIWTQSLLILGLLGWTGTYLLRVVNQKMTLNQQLEDYKLAVLQKRYESLSPEEREKLEAEVRAEEQRRQAQTPDA